jgi:pimeloyl-ACP methyl ester carboxylesterase
VIPLHLHRKIAIHPTGPIGAAENRTVLFVHGGTTPAVAAFGFEHKDYNWMAFLARNGFDVWGIDLTGYGASARPMMDDPCNVNPEHQKILLKRPLAAPCPAHYPFRFKTVKDDWAEIDTAVEHIRRVTGAAKVSIVAWSAGVSRAGGYAALHQDKINRIVFYAPGGVRAGFKPPAQPGAGYPVVIQTRGALEGKRWDPDVRCTGQVEPGVRDALWQQIMRWDSVGASWGPEEGVMRAPTTTNGWSPEMAGSLRVPSLGIVGEYDTPEPRRKAFDAIGSNDKVWLKVACASHFMLWEKQHKTLHNASLQWLRDGRLSGASRGAFEADADGRLKKVE